MLKHRSTLTEEEVLEKSKEITNRLLGEEHFKNSETVAFYLPKGREVDTKIMMEEVIGEKEILVPVTNNEIEMVKFNSFEELVDGKFGVPEPNQKISPHTFSDVIIVPGVCFGLCMHRLGYGKGYYDRFLSHSPAYRIGVCYDFQIVEKLPSHENDQRMDMIITDKQVIRI